MSTNSIYNVSEQGAESIEKFAEALTKIALCIQKQTVALNGTFQNLNANIGVGRVEYQELLKQAEMVINTLLAIADNLNPKIKKLVLSIHEYTQGRRR